MSASNSYLLNSCPCHLVSLSSSSLLHFSSFSFSSLLSSNLRRLSSLPSSSLRRLLSFSSSSCLHFSSFSSSNCLHFSSFSSSLLFSSCSSSAFPFYLFLLAFLFLSKTLLFSLQLLLFTQKFEELFSFQSKIYQVEEMSPFHSVTIPRLFAFTAQLLPSKLRPFPS